ncbi:MAG: hypothetical protein DRJ62_05000, partial [Thermoprotei archaeon]
STSIELEPPVMEYTFTHYKTSPRSYNMEEGDINLLSLALNAETTAFSAFYSKYVMIGVERRGL